MMIIIKNIEIIEVDRDPWELIAKIPMDGVIPVNGNKYIETKLFIELIGGQRFVRPDGKELIIGCSKQAEEVIGIQYEAWGNMSKEWEITRQELYTERGERLKVEGELLKVKQLGFFRRLVALFKGYQ